MFVVTDLFLRLFNRYNISCDVEGDTTPTRLDKIVWNVNLNASVDTM